MKVLTMKNSTYPEEKCEELGKLTLCRESHVSMLLAIFGERQHLSFPSIFIYGHTGTGKTYVLQTLLNTLELPYALINCVECFSPRLIYEEILNKLHNHYPAPENEYSSYERCDTFNDFVRMFKKAVVSEDLVKETVYITECNVTVLLLTEIVWETFRPNTGCLEPLSIYFADYSKAELQKILSSDNPDEYSAEFYASYINILLGVFYTVCRDIKELRHLVRIGVSLFILLPTMWSAVMSQRLTLLTFSNERGFIKV
uniref:Orc1-like AAA ATPase domain-containing protein n=1 Tax=Leptobrachium leishanense TaxID=445787 RepID=A0A8C5MMX8_9ANUR